MVMEKRVVVRYLAGFGAAATMAFAAGCGSETAPPGQSGQVIQGPVSGAVVFADKKLAGKAFGNFVKDADEVAAQNATDAQGNFTLSSVPGYEYVIVSQGGKDEITQQPAMQLLAPVGARNVTPLTTIVTLEPSVQAKIEALGVKFDDNIATSATPAALLLVKSIETVVAALTESLDPAGTKLSVAQVNDVQAKVVAAIAAELKKDAVTVNTVVTPATLQTTMASALSTAIADIDSTSSNIQVPDAAAVASSCASTVSAVASAISSTGTFSITTTVSEATTFDKAKVDTIANQVATVATSNSTKVTVTPTPTTPSATGSTGGTGGSGVGGNF